MGRELLMIQNMWQSMGEQVNNICPKLKGHLFYCILTKRFKHKILWNRNEFSKIIIFKYFIRSKFEKEYEEFTY